MCAAAAIFKWMQAGRMSLAWVGPGYAALSAEHPPMSRRLVVRAQMVRMKYASVHVRLHTTDG